MISRSKIVAFTNVEEGGEGAYESLLHGAAVSLRWSYCVTRKRIGKIENGEFPPKRTSSDLRTVGCRQIRTDRRGAVRSVWDEITDGCLAECELRRKPPVVRTE